MSHREAEFDHTHVPRTAKILSCRRALAVMLKHHGCVPPEPGASQQAVRIRSQIAAYANQVSVLREDARRRRCLACGDDLTVHRDIVKRRRAIIQATIVRPDKLSDLIKTVTAAHGVFVGDVVRRHTIADHGTPQAAALAEICRRAREFGIPPAHIGKVLGGRDRTTIIYQSEKRSTATRGCRR